MLTCCSMQLFNVTGICLSFFVNYGMNIQIKTLSSAKWRVPFALQMLPGALLLAGIVFQNESPRWLVEKNRLQEARQALARVRGRNVDDHEVVQELDEIMTDFEGHEKLPLKAQLKAAVSTKSLFYRTSFAVILMFWQQWYVTLPCKQWSFQEALQGCG
jgi:MFS transporter, SP family, sugar:H+ symporter